MPSAHSGHQSEIENLNDIATLDPTFPSVRQTGKSRIPHLASSMEGPPVSSASNLDEMSENRKVQKDRTSPEQNGKECSPGDGTSRDEERSRCNKLSQSDLDEFSDSKEVSTVDDSPKVEDETLLSGESSDDSTATTTQGKPFQPVFESQAPHCVIMSAGHRVANVEPRRSTPSLTGTPPPRTSHNSALQDYQLQLMLLEQQNQKRLMIARREQLELDETRTDTAESTTKPPPAAGSAGQDNTPRCAHYLNYVMDQPCTKAKL